MTNHSVTQSRLPCFCNGPSLMTQTMVNQFPKCRHYYKNLCFGITSLNPFMFSDATWWHRFWLPFPQRMACCLTAQNYYLTQCWLNINGVQWPLPMQNCTGSDRDIIPWNQFHEVICEITFLPQANVYRRRLYTQKHYGQTLYCTGKL